MLSCAHAMVQKLESTSSTLMKNQVAKTQQTEQSTQFLIKGRRILIMRIPTNSLYFKNKNHIK